MASGTDRGPRDGGPPYPACWSSVPGRGTWVRWVHSWFFFDFFRGPRRWVGRVQGSSTDPQGARGASPGPPRAPRDPLVRFQGRDPWAGQRCIRSPISMHAARGRGDTAPHGSQQLRGGSYAAPGPSHHPPGPRVRFPAGTHGQGSDAFDARFRCMLLGYASGGCPQPSSTGRLRFPGLPHARSPAPSRLPGGSGAFKARFRCMLPG